MIAKQKNMANQTNLPNTVEDALQVAQPHLRDVEKIRAALTRAQGIGWLVLEGELAPAREDNAGTWWPEWPAIDGASIAMTPVLLAIARAQPDNAYDARRLAARIERGRSDRGVGGTVDAATLRRHDDAMRAFRHDAVMELVDTSHGPWVFLHKIEDLADLSGFAHVARALPHLEVDEHCPIVRDEELTRKEPPRGEEVVARTGIQREQGWDYIVTFEGGTGFVKKTKDAGTPHPVVRTLTTFIHDRDVRSVYRLNADGDVVRALPGGRTSKSTTQKVTRQTTKKKKRS